MQLRAMTIATRSGSERIEADALAISGGSYNAVGMLNVAAAAVQAGLCQTVLCLHVAKSFSVRSHGRSWCSAACRS